MGVDAVRSLGEYESGAVRKSIGKKKREGDRGREKLRGRIARKNRMIKRPRYGSLACAVRDGWSRVPVTSLHSDNARQW